MGGFFNEPSLLPHRHSFYMLYWTTAGTGLHLIGFREYEMLPGRVFFLQQNQVHQVVTYPEDGYMVLFNQMYFQAFLKHNQQMEQTGLFDYFNRSPFVDLDETMMHTFSYIVNMLKEETAKVYNMPLNQHYLSILLLYAGKQHLQSNHFTENSVQADLMRKLKILIEANYKKERFAPFYSEILGLPTRKLNEYAMSNMGIMVQDMVAMRRLAESEALLASTDSSFKTIAYELGFGDSSHLWTFFKKYKGISPSDFRQKYKQINENAQTDKGCI
ncbi:helix-turn-helix domain-containing protein [Mucilaginibacter gracilis]|nr:helix-turn-helix domain-containing protein [Mucilaginibacter gracilis]